MTEVYIVAEQHQNYDKSEKIVYAGLDRERAEQSAIDSANSYRDGHTKIHVWLEGEYISSLDYYSSGNENVRSLYVSDGWCQEEDEDTYTTTLDRYLDKKKSDNPIVTNSKVIQTYCNSAVLIEGDYAEVVKEARAKGISTFDFVYLTEEF